MAHHPATPSRLMPLLAGMTAGVFVTSAAQVLLNNRGMKVGAIWQNAANGDAINLKAAVVWWVIAGSALAVGAAVAYGLARAPAPWRRYSEVRWVLSGLGLVALAHVAHETTGPEGIGPLAQLGSAAAATMLAALMAAFGAIFALRSQ